MPDWRNRHGPGVDAGKAGTHVGCGATIAAQPEAFAVPSMGRSPRFLVAAPVVWRPRGADGWLEGVSVNVSRSGVLMQTDRIPPAGTPIEIVIALSRLDLPDDEVADVACAGRVVRTERTRGGRLPCRVAATIDSYSLLRRPE